MESRYKIGRERKREREGEKRKMEREGEWMRKRDGEEGR